MTDAYPRECPVCGRKCPRPSAFDLHLLRTHDDETATAAVADAITAEIGEQP